MESINLIKEIELEQVEISHVEPFIVSALDKNGIVYRFSYAEAPQSWLWDRLPEAVKMSIIKRISH